VQSANRKAGLPEPDLVSASQTDADIASLLAGHTEDGSGPQWPHPLAPLVRELPVFRQELREWMARATDYGVTNEQLEALAETHSRPEWAAAAAFRAEYHAVLASARPGAFDSSEIIRRAIVVLETGLPPGLESLVHVCVDDVHDMTQASLEFLGALKNLGVGLTVVAEPDVAGNTFRGSEPEGLSRLAGMWSLTPEVLQSVHRHGSAIRTLVSRVTEKIGTAGMGLQRSASSAHSEPGEVLTLLAPSSHRESNDIASFIMTSHLQHGVPLDRIAVVSRRGSRVQRLVRELTNHGIAARANLAGVALRDQPAARDLLELVAIGLGLRPLGPQTAVALLSGRYGLMTTQELRRLRFALRLLADPEEPYQPADQLLADALCHRGGFALVEPGVGAKATVIAQILDDIRQAPPATPVTELLWMAWSASSARLGWEAGALAGGDRSGSAHRALDAVVALFHQAAEFVEAQPGASSAVFIDNTLDAEVPDDVVLPASAWSAVTVSTPSGLQGTEFDVVIISGVEEGVWPDLRLRGSLLRAHQMVRSARGEGHDVLDERKIVKDDELRLFAMAISRATTTVLVTATDSEESPPSPLFHLVDTQATRIPSRPEGPLSERTLTGLLRRDLVRALERGVEAGALADDLGILASMGAAGAHPREWWGIALPSSDGPLYPEGDVPVSPSALATLEESPIEWFLGTLARNESAPERGLGSLLHRALEEHPGGSADELWAVVDQSFGQLDYEPGWVLSVQRRSARVMVEAMADYVRDREGEGFALSGVEQGFQMHFGRAVVRGMIDRIEVTPDQKLLVVDLKTGQYVTDAGVVDNPQMFAYQLALQSPELRAQMGLADMENAGAVLLFVKSGVGGKRYRLATQAPLDDTGREACVERLDKAVAVICAAEFAGEPRVFGAGGHSRHRWHFVGQVCGDV
jgi:superfamily I DNA/RNA helicase/RecB family exonuclease